jgi:hypothetical protein
MKQWAPAAIVLLLSSCVGPQFEKAVSPSTSPITSLATASSRFERINGRLPRSVEDLVNADTGFDSRQFARLEFHPRHDGSVDYYVESKRLDETAFGHSQLKGWVTLHPTTQPTSEPSRSTR